MTLYLFCRLMVRTDKGELEITAGVTSFPDCKKCNEATQKL